MNNKFTKEICYSNEKSMKFLEEWMIHNRYIMERPIDQTVNFNIDNIKYVSKLIYRDNIEEIKLKNKVKKLEEELESIKFSRTWKYTNFIRSINKKILLKKGKKVLNTMQ